VIAVGAKGSKTKATLIRTRTALLIRDSETDSSFVNFFPQIFSLKTTEYVPVFDPQELDLLVVRRHFLRLRDCN